MTQSKWTTEMQEGCTELISQIIDALRAAIWRPAGQTKSPTGSSEEEIERHGWLQPLQMPRLHALGQHVLPFVEAHGFYSLFSEEGFEHYQQTSKVIRPTHCRNQSMRALYVGSRLECAEKGAIEC